MNRVWIATISVWLAAGSVWLAGTGLPIASSRSQCVPGTVSAEQQARRRDGVRLARLINTAEANQPGAERRQFLTRQDLATSPYVRQRAGDAFVASLNFTGEEVMPGWELKLDVTAEGYWFMIRDKTDPCGFALVSNQSGLIYTAEPIR